MVMWECARANPHFFVFPSSARRPQAAMMMADGRKLRF
jgi:hypothetical protein